jgi:O-antigen ligase
VVLFGVRLSGAELYGLAFLSVAPILLRYFRDPEPFLALFILYLPLSRAYVVPLAPGINGTNLFELGLLLALILAKVRGDAAPARHRPIVAVVWLWAVLSLLSFLTTMERVGLSQFASDHTQSLKAWLDQFIIFFAIAGLVRDRPMARRLIVYLMIGSAVVVVMGFQEWLEKRYLGSIDKARLLGPQIQSNDFGAYLVYSSVPFLGIFIANWEKWRVWLMLPYFAVLARVLLATFSRGAYIGFGLAVVAATYCRSKVLLVLAVAVGLGMIAVEPSLVPESMKARVEQTTVEPETDDEGGLDKSSETRLILWKAAVAMTLERPILGHGFGSFPQLKSKYTERYVRESDNHNMFLYIASQMGIPALLAFLLVVWRTYSGGRHLYLAGANSFDKAIGLGAAALAGGIVGVNMFGSRMVDIAVSGYFWMFLATFAALLAEPKRGATESEPESRSASP